MDGVYWRGASALYVSRGVGVTALPFRLGVSAEVPLFDLRPASSETRQEWAKGEFELLTPFGEPVVDAPGEAVYLGVEAPPGALPATVEEQESTSR